MSNVPARPQASYPQRIAFVAEMAVRLHRYGTTAQRLEAAITALSQRLDLECEAWSNPTGLILSFSDPGKPLGSTDTTRVIRLSPGENDLHKLCEADRVAEAVANGQLTIAQGHTALRVLDRAPTPMARFMQVLGFGLAAAGVAGLWRLPWLDISVAAVTGLLIGLLGLYCGTRRAMMEAREAVGALAAGPGVALVAALVAPLNLSGGMIASLVAPLPGMAIASAMSELSSRHWVSGTVRFAGALTTVLKLAAG